MAATGPRTTPEPLYGGASTGRRVTVRDIAALAGSSTVAARPFTVHLSKLWMQLQRSK